MTPADHANTVRDWLDANGAAPYVVAALNTLQAQAEERDALRESGQRWAENVRVKEQRIVAAEAELKEAYAKLERTNESFLATEAERDHERRRHAQAVEAFTKRDRECLAAEAERDELLERITAGRESEAELMADNTRLREALVAIDREIGLGMQDSYSYDLLMSVQKIARAALAGEDK